MQRFTELKVWQRSHQLALGVYRLTREFPRAEQYGLVAQVRRAVVSVVSNIAEGAKRQSNLDYARFLNVAEASLAETEALLRLSGDLAMASTRAVAPLIEESEEVSRMIFALRRSLGVDKPERR